MGSNITYRPKELDEIVGNKETVDALKSMLKDPKNIPNGFLFTGPTGCGKTTLARIVKTKLECSDFDFKEIDMGSNRGIDTARDIIQTAYLKPLAGKKKIYLLDECHKSTTDFQNALLKILEEPPSFVHFILCTTEPEKLIKTIRGRCVQFSVSPLNEKKMKRLIDNVCEKEGIETFSDEVQAELYKHSEGLPRNALMMFDKIKSLDPGQYAKAIESVRKNEKGTIDLCRALLAKSSWNEITEIIKGLDEEPEKIRRAVLGYASAVLLSKNNPQAALMLESFKDNYYDSGKPGLVYSCYLCIF